MQGGAGPPFRNPPSVRDVGSAFPPHEIRTPATAISWGPRDGASLRVRSRPLVTREDQLTHRAEPVLTATPGLLDKHWGCAPRDRATGRPGRRRRGARPGRADVPAPAAGGGGPR